MQKAGLNPILSATGGSGAATGGSVGLPDYDLGSGLTTALQYRQQKNQIKNRDANTAGLLKRYETMNKSDLMNAISNQTSSNANAWYNRHRAIGFSSSWSNSSGGDESASTPVFSKKAGWNSGTSYSRAW